MIFALVLRNTSVSSHRILQEDFPFLSLLLLEKINSWATDVVKCTTQEKYLRMGACENVLLEIPCFKPVNFQKNYFSISSLSENSREFGFEITWYFAEKIKNYLIC